MSVHKVWATVLLSTMLVALVVCVIVLKNDTYQIDTPQDKQIGLSVLAEDVCEQEYSCASCSQVRICRKTPHGLKEVFRLSCSGSAPYCDPTSGACSATPSHECADLGAFSCMQDGVFADPSDCEVYHVCQNGTSHTFRCESGKYFNGTKCGTASCRTVDCTGKSGIKVSHPLNATTYAYCVNGKPLFMDLCPPGQIMYADQQQCLPQCSYSGAKIADPSDCTRFYTCSSSYPGYKLSNGQCPPGRRFDPASASCGSSSPIHCSPSRGAGIQPIVIVRID